MRRFDDSTSIVGLIIMQFEEPAGHLNDIEGRKHSRLLGLRRGLEAVETGHNSIEAMNWNVCPTMLPCQLMRGREIFITAGKVCHVQLALYPVTKHSPWELLQNEFSVRRNQK